MMMIAMTSFSWRPMIVVYVCWGGLMVFVGRGWFRFDGLRIFVLREIDIWRCWGGNYICKYMLAIDLEVGFVNRMLGFVGSERTRM